MELTGERFHVPRRKEMMFAATQDIMKGSKFQIPLEVGRYCEGKLTYQMSGWSG